MTQPIMKTHMEQAKTMARARMVVDAVLELRLVEPFQPAGSTDVSNWTAVGVEVGKDDGEVVGWGCAADVLAVELG